MKPDLSFLPGRFRIQRGCFRDYRALSRFHYRPKHPCYPTQVWVVRYRAPCAPWRVVAVAVMAYPTRFSSSRSRVLGVHGANRAQLDFINRHMRTISRVIVHPQFRALGLSSLLVRCICKHCDTRYVEAMAVMGRAHPFFERGGMKRYEPIVPDAPVYYLHKARRQTHNVQRSTLNFELPTARS
jgi:hypothetical protein